MQKKAEKNKLWHSKFWLVSRIFRAGSKTKKRDLRYKSFRKPKSGARINKDTNKF